MGGIQDALVEMKGSVVKVSVPRGHGAAFGMVTVSGRQLMVPTMPDHSPKTPDGLHTVFKSESFADVTGQAI